jgi:hypothetical protein
MTDKNIKADINNRLVTLQIISEEAIKMHEKSREEDINIDQFKNLLEGLKKQ